MRCRPSRWTPPCCSRPHRHRHQLSDIPGLRYADELFREKNIRSVTANTRADGEEFLRLAAALRVRATVSPRPLDEADAALADLAADRITGAAVLTMS